MLRQQTHDRTARKAHPARRWLLATLAALMLIGASGWLVPTDVAAGRAGTIVTDGAPLFADHDDHTVIDWMHHGARVDYFWGPHNGLYEVRYYGTVGWTWVENVILDGESAPASGGGGGGEVAAPAPAPEPVWAERWIDVNRSSGAVSLMEGNSTLAVYWGVLSRSQGEDFYATASGTYYIYAMNADLTYTPYARNYISHWMAFDPERDNGFHSYVKYEDGSIHPNGAGPTAGCVALAPGDIDAVFNFAYVGMRVEVHW